MSSLSSLISIFRPKKKQITAERQTLKELNVLLLTYDSCRYDALKAAKTPVLDSFCEIRAAQTPGNFTYAAHQAFFAGILPNVTEDIPYYNRFNKQLLGIGNVGETNVVKDALIWVRSDRNLLTGLAEAGFRTVGAGAMNWFKQKSLTSDFQYFKYTATDADAQIDYLLESIAGTDKFFGFINFGETHAPYQYRGKKTTCPVDVRARLIKWPPAQSAGPVGDQNDGFAHQIEAAEFLDSRLPRLFSALPSNTVVVLCGDHGECFGEDGYWGHGFNHPAVLEVPLAIFRLDGKPL